MRVAMTMLFVSLTPNSLEIVTYILAFDYPIFITVVK